MNILDFYEMNNFWTNILGFSLPASKMVVAKCLKLIWNHSGIYSGTYFSPFQGVYYLYMGLRRAQKPYFGLILEFWIIFLIFCEWIILLNILDSIEWIFFWMNIPDFVLNWILNWIIFRPDSMKKWIFKTYRTGLPSDDHPMTIRWLLMTIRWLYNDYPMTIRWLSNDYPIITSHWQAPTGSRDSQKTNPRIFKSP